MGKRAVIVDILSDASGFVKGSKQAGDATLSLEEKIDKLGKSIALGYSAKKVLDFAKAAVDAAMDDAASQKTLAIALKNTAGATDENVASAEEWITAMQQQKVFADTDLRAALATLTGATGDVAEAQDLMSLAMDTARAKGVPLATVADALAKAHSGNTRALLSLVPGLKQAGEKTIDFATAQERLNEQVKGQAEAFAATDAGKLEAMNLQWGEMQETIGTALLPAMSQLIGVVSDIFGWFNSLDQDTQQLIITVGAFAGGLYVVVSAASSVKSAIEVLGISAKSSLGWVGLLITGATVLYEIFAGGDDTTIGVAEATGAFADQLNRSTAELLLNVDAIRQIKGELPDTTAGFTALSNAVIAALNEENAGSGDRLSAMLGEMGLTTQEAATAMLVTKDAIDSNSYSYGQLAAAVFGITKEQVEWLRSTKTGAGAMTEAEVAAAGLNVELFRQRDKILAVENGAQDLRVAFQGSTVDAKAMAQGFIDQARGASDLTQSLVGTAEANAEANGQGGDALAIYLEYIRLTGGLSEEQQRLALDLDAAAKANAQLPPVIDETTDAMDDQTVAANTNRDAIRELTDAFSGLLAALDDRDAVRNMETAFDDVTKKANAAADAGAAAVAAQQEADKARADGAKDAAEKQKAADQAMQDYEEATRASAQAQDDLRREVIAFGDEVDGIPPEKISEILAMIDDGSVVEAEAALHSLEHDRRVMFSAVLDPATDKITIGSLGNIHLSAAGRFVDRPMITAVGEGYRKEVILPLESPGRLAELLAHPEVAGPVADAFPSVLLPASERASVPSGGGSAGGGTTVVNNLNGYLSERMLVELSKKQARFERGKR